jgi:hypothetical protein
VYNLGFLLVFSAALFFIFNDRAHKRIISLLKMLRTAQFVARSLGKKKSAVGIVKRFLWLNNVQKNNISQIRCHGIIKNK